MSAPAGLKVLHGLTGIKYKMPRLAMPPKLPSGSTAYKPLPLDQQLITTGPGSAPTGFLGPYNSETEWMVYWGLSKIFNNPPQPRLGPFEGGWPDWQYQKAWNGGRDSPGGSVIDFVVYNPGPSQFTIGIRVVTEYWHIYANNEKQTADEEQRFFLEDDFDVKDLYDYDFVNDPTGQAVIVSLKNICGMLERPNPNWLGTALRGSRMDHIGGY